MSGGMVGVANSSFASSPPAVMNNAGIKGYIDLRNIILHFERHIISETSFFETTQWYGEILLEACTRIAWTEVHSI